MDWFGIYIVGAVIVGVLGALAVFLGAWFLAAQQWGVWAYLLGWLPASILAFVSMYVIGALWPIIAAALGFWALRSR